jgi:hypothetical protein
MQTVKTLRELWRRRAVVGVLAVLSFLLAFTLTYRLGLPPTSRQYTVGVAGARILVDTPKSQFVEVAPLGADTLGQRANVLAALMAEGNVKAVIAQQARLAPDELLAVSESSEQANSVSASADLSAPGIYLLHTRVVRDSEGGQLPIIEVETQAPDSAGATRLVNAVVSGVSQYLDSKAAGEQVADRRRLRISSIGIDPGRTEVRGAGALLGLAAGIFAFLFGCATMLAIAAISRGWREAETHEQSAQEALDRSRDAGLTVPSGRVAGLNPVAQDAQTVMPSTASPSAHINLLRAYTAGDSPAADGEPPPRGPRRRESSCQNPDSVAPASAVDPLALRFDAPGDAPPPARQSSPNAASGR